MALEHADLTIPAGEIASPTINLEDRELIALEVHGVDDDVEDVEATILFRANGLPVYIGDGMAGLEIGRGYWPLDPDMTRGLSGAFQVCIAKPDGTVGRLPADLKITAVLAYR